MGLSNDLGRIDQGNAGNTVQHEVYSTGAAAPNPGSGNPLDIGIGVSGGIPGATMHGGYLLPNQGASVPPSGGSASIPSSEMIDRSMLSGLDDGQ